MTDKIDEWWTENNAPINLMTVGRINFSSGITRLDLPALNKILPREVLLEIVGRHERVSDFYHVGPVQKASIESFVDDIIEYLSKR